MLQVPAQQTTPEPPALGPGVELLGAMPGTAYQHAQWLAVRNGQYVQLTELLYRICQSCDGTRTLAEIAEAVTDTTEWLVTPETVEQLIEKKLAPIGLVWTDSSEVLAAPSAVFSPLRVQLRTKVVGHSAIGPVTRVLQTVFAPVLMVPILGVIAAAHVWLYGFHGIGQSVSAVVRAPGLMLLLLPVLFVGLAFHELGHACALSYGGGRVREMGIGLYLILPAFFTDTTDAYRLDKPARVRTDLGGFYFHGIFVLGLMAVYLLTGQEWLLLPVLLIDIDVLYQCVPLVRLDGYWTLADITGVPDFFSLMGAFLASITPAHGKGRPVLPPLRPRARQIFLVYILLVVPLLAVIGIFALAQMPWLLRTTWTAAVLQQQLLSQAVDAGDAVLAAISVLQMLLVLLPLLGTIYLLFSLAKPTIAFAYRRVVARSSQERPAA